MGQLDLSLEPRRRIYSVAELTAGIRDLLEAEFGDVWVAGEISNARAAHSGHHYFTLKDGTAQLRAVCFRQHALYLKIKPQNGLEVIARGRIGVYEARGEYQLYVEHLELRGYGALQLAFEQLKKKLADEGLFDSDRKRPLPSLPRRIGIVTSPSGAAIADMLRILERRFDGLHIQLYPVQVQGEGAAEQIANGVRYFSRTRCADVLIVGRGGGSLEDLWAFNEEVVARAIADSEIPVVSAVGHQTDFTIADFAADVRAPTPSAAAELVVRRKQEFLEVVIALKARLAQAARYKLATAGRDVLDRRMERATALVRRELASFSQKMDELTFALRIPFYAVCETRSGRGNVVGAGSNSSISGCGWRASKRAWMVPLGGFRHWPSGGSSAPIRACSCCGKSWLTSVRSRFSDVDTRSFKRKTARSSGSRSRRTKGRGWVCGFILAVSAYVLSWSNPKTVIPCRAKPQERREGWVVRPRAALSETV